MISNTTTMQFSNNGPSKLSQQSKNGKITAANIYKQLGIKQQTKSPFTHFMQNRPQSPNKKKQAVTTLNGESTITAHCIDQFRKKLEDKTKQQTYKKKAKDAHIHTIHSEHEPAIARLLRKHFRKQLRLVLPTLVVVYPPKANGTVDLSNYEVLSMPKQIILLPSTNSGSISPRKNGKQAIIVITPNSARRAVQLYAKQRGSGNGNSSGSSGQQAYSSSSDQKNEEDDNDYNSNDSSSGNGSIDGNGSGNNNKNNDNNNNGNNNQHLLRRMDRQWEATIEIIDGTKKIKYNTTYWVQRNVVTVQIISSFEFDECRITCSKESTSDVKQMETVPFANFIAKHDSPKTIYEHVFKKKLPHTSGRPETQKYIWLSAEFILRSEIICRCSSDKFFVCSRPAGELSVPPIVKKSKKSSSISSAHHHQDKKHSNSNHVMHANPAINGNGQQQQQQNGGNNFAHQQHGPNHAHQHSQQHHHHHNHHHQQQQQQQQQQHPLSPIASEAAHAAANQIHREHMNNQQQQQQQQQHYQQNHHNQQQQQQQQQAHVSANSNVVVPSGAGQQITVQQNFYVQTLYNPQQPYFVYNPNIKQSPSPIPQQQQQQHPQQHPQQQQQQQHPQQHHTIMHTKEQFPETPVPQQQQQQQQHHQQVQQHQQQQQYSNNNNIGNSSNSNNNSNSNNSMHYHHNQQVPPAASGVLHQQQHPNHHHHHHQLIKEANNNNTIIVAPVQMQQQHSFQPPLNLHIHNPPDVQLQQDQKTPLSSSSSAIGKSGNNNSGTKPYVNIHYIMPSSGPVEGNQRVTIFGEFFKPQQQHLMVYFGLLPSPNIEYMDSHKIVCVSPSRLISGAVAVSCVLEGKTIGNSVPYTFISG